MEESGGDGSEDDEEPSSPADVDITGQRDTTENLEAEGDHSEVFWVGQVTNANKGKEVGEVHGGFDAGDKEEQT